MSIDDRPIIVGGGLAGLMAALHLAPEPVLVLSAAPLGEQAASGWAQGGLAAAIGADDSVDLHLADTLAAGAGLCDPDVARRIVEAGPALVDELAGLGARFDRDAEGRIGLGLEAGHGRRRIVHAAGDASGREILRAVIAAVRRTPSITVWEGVTATRLIMRDGAVAGVLALPVGGGSARVVRSSRVVIATGGSGGLYEHSTNPAGAVGGGLMLAARAGAALADLEFVQFHPTALDVAPAGDRHGCGSGDRHGCGSGDRHGCGSGDRHGCGSGDRHGCGSGDRHGCGSGDRHGCGSGNRHDGIPMPLVSEAVRGEGAVLVDETGERFMAGCAQWPRAELEPRDIVSRAVWARMQGGHQVFLDARDALGARFATRFPGIYAACMAAGVDPAVSPIPIRPAAHYHMGGIAVDADCRSTLPGLWAAGEAACTGLHGANRLASNSLLEAAVTGRIAAASLAGTQAKRAAPMAAVGGQIASDPAAVRAIMSQHAGVLRDADGLASAIGQLSALPAGSDHAALALMMTVAMQRRQESRGGHTRTDYPDASPGVVQRMTLTLDQARAFARASPAAMQARHTP